MHVGGQLGHRHPAFFEGHHVVVGGVAAELVSDGGTAFLPDAHLCEGVAVAVDVCEKVVAVAVPVDEASLVGLEHHGRVLVHDVVAELLRHALADDDVSRVHQGALRYEAVAVEFLVVVGLQRCRHGGWPAEEFLLARRVVLVVLLAKRLEDRRREEAAFDGRLVHDDGVLLVESRVRGDGHDHVDAAGDVVAMQQRRHLRGDERPLGVVQHVAHRVVAVSVVGRVHGDGLLAHGGLVRITRRLVVVREGDRARDRAQHQRRVELHVCVLGLVHHLVRLEGFGGHRDHREVCLLHVEVLDDGLAGSVGCRHISSRTTTNTTTTDATNTRIISCSRTAAVDVICY